MKIANNKKNKRLFNELYQIHKMANTYSKLLFIEINRKLIK